MAREGGTGVILLGDREGPFDSDFMGMRGMGVCSCKGVGSCR